MTKMEQCIMEAVTRGCHTHDMIRNYVLVMGHKLWADHDVLGRKLRDMAADGHITYQRRQMTYSWYGLKSEDNDND